MPFTFLETPLSPLFIHYTNSAVTKITFTELSDFSDSSKDFPEFVSLCKQQLNDYFEGRSFNFNFKHEQAGTAFQQKVWEELAKVKPGQTMSYMQLSKNLQNPLAIRAVANANGKNDLAIVIPCHRIIGSNGSLTGYAGGLWRKKWLLDHEAKFLNGTQKLF